MEIGKISIKIATILLFWTLVGCSSSNLVEEGAERVEDIPEWFLSPPQDSDQYLYAIGHGESARIDLARTRAEISAKNNLAGKLGQKIESLQKLFEDEIQSNDVSSYSSSFTNAIQIITNQDLIGYSIDEQKFSAKADGGYINYTLLKIPLGTAREQLENALSNDEKMYIRLRESEAFLELKKNLQRLNN